MPSNTTELIGLLSLLGCWGLVLGSLRSWSRRIPNATERIPGGVDGLLFVSAAWAASAALFDLTSFGLALGHLSNLHAAGLDASEAVFAVLVNGSAAAALIIASGMLLLGRRRWIPLAAAVLMTSAVPVLETVLWMRSGDPWHDYLGFLWLIGIAVLPPLFGERARNTYGS